MSSADPGRQGPVRAVVLGVGNVLHRDDGLGPHVVRALRERRARAGGGGRPDAGPDPADGREGGDGLPAEVELVDGGTAGLALLPLLRETDRLVIVDAVVRGAPAGSLHVLRGAAVGGGSGPGTTVHQVGVADLLAVARLVGALPADVVLVGVEPAGVELGPGLSPQVEAAVPAVLDAVRLCLCDLCLCDLCLCDRPAVARG